MDAGEEMFTRNGFRNTTMDQIAAHCEIARGTIYLYFRNKYELFVELLIRSLDIFISDIHEKLKTAETIEDMLKAVGDSYLELYRKKRNSFFLMNFHDTNGGEDVVPREKLQKLMDKNRELWRIIVEIIEEGKSNGFFRNDANSNEFSVMLWSASNGVIMQMDHMMNSHKQQVECFGNPEECRDFIDTFITIDYVGMLYRLWDSLIRSIMTKTNDN